ncbi:copper ion binding protein [Alkalicoccus urumqiensis]|uniref:Copper chaperone CopZ n=1 Tax=Alkalicoccus urumqiensis TaxID=1548213 RepID=A0A2P6MDU9_ALKUR|nr:copper ion binding protein [Alkalicoccus urumqiensis]PRO64458.1 hypothetical protein C6I21_14775 [Alkalicoccus urumqiensis]
MKTETIHVEGMTCGHCKQAVEGAASSVEGVSRAQVNLEAGLVEVEMNDDASVEQIIEEIEDQGYDVKQ